MSHEGKVALRPDSWDALILETVGGGEYGTIDVRGKVVVDIGAHIGGFAMLAAEQGARRVLAYEAGEENFRLLSINASCHPAIDARRAAVWRSDRDGARVRWRASSNARNTGGGSVVACTAVAGVALDDADAVPVTTVAFDAVIDELGTVDLVKIDAEGSEYPILATSRRLDRVHAIVGEYHAVDGLDASMRVPGLDAWTGDALLDLLDERGFDVWVRPIDATLGLFRAVRR